MKVEKWFIMLCGIFACGIFPSLPTEATGRSSDLAVLLKILTPNQMLQRLPIRLAQVKASNTSENLLNEICQITGKVYNRMKSIHIIQK